MASPLEDPLSHSMDTDFFHFPGGGSWDVHEATRPYIEPILGWAGIHGLSKFMAMELVAAALCILTFLPLAVNIRWYGYPRGVFANLIESILVFIRERVAIPAIGEHDAHKFLPFLWSLFFFILYNNLLGMIPMLGSPTAGLGATAGLALCAFVMIHFSGIVKLGPVGYGKAFVPHVPALLYPLMLVIEIVGAIIKPTILAVRLFVNMLAGHTVLYVILGFVMVIGWNLLYFIVTPASVFGNVLLSMLELFVAFLQAYVFTFLSAIFIGAAVHPHH